MREREAGLKHLFHLLPILAALLRRWHHVDQQAQLAGNDLDLRQCLDSGSPLGVLRISVLRELLPASVAGLDQGEVEGATDGAMGFSISRVEAAYPGAEGAQIDISVMDYGAIPSMAMMGLGWTMADIDRESGATYERTVAFGGQRGFRSYDADARSGEFSLIVGDRFHVEVTGTGVSDDDLEAALRAVDLSGLAALRDEGRPDA